MKLTIGDIVIELEGKYQIILDEHPLGLTPDGKPDHYGDLSTKITIIPSSSTRETIFFFGGTD